MRLTNNNIKRLCELAIKAAKNAGELIESYSTQNVPFKNKSEGLSSKEALNIGESLSSQVVTEVDILSQKIILDILLPTCITYDLAILTEESDDNKSRLEKDYFWCIDPLDGTLPFIESKPGYSVSIALVERSGIPVIGVVYDPSKKILYTAIKGNGAFRNGEKWKINSKPLKKYNLLTVVTDRSFTQQSNYKNIENELKKTSSILGLENIIISQYGGGALNACQVLENAPACYFKFPKLNTGGGSLWDFAATACIFNELGAPVTDIFGNPLDLNRSDSTFMNLKGVLYASDKYISKLIADLYSNR